MLKRMFIVLFCLISFNAQSAKYQDTQYGPDGVEVHLLKANVANNILTFTFMVDNSTENKVSFPSMVAANVNYTTKDKKFPVLQDTEDKWLASTITYKKHGFSATLFTFHTSPYTNHYIKMKKNQKVVGWVKFEAPKDDEWPIEVSLPGIGPFTIERP